MLVAIYQITLWHIPEDNSLHKARSLGSRISWKRSVSLLNCLQQHPAELVHSTVKGKAVPVLKKFSTMPWIRNASGCIDLCFLALGTSWKWVVCFTPRPLYPRYSLNRRLDGPLSRSGRHGDVKILASIGTNPLVVQPVASRYTDHTACAIQVIHRAVAKRNNFVLGATIRVLTITS
jgi:hypothetical protein